MLRSLSTLQMADPRTDPAAQRHLLKLLDSIGTEHDIRRILIGGTVTSHLQAIQSIKPAAAQRQ